MKLLVKLVLYAAAIFYIFPHIAGIKVTANILQVLALAVLLPLADQLLQLIVGNLIGLLHALSSGLLTPLTYPFLMRTAYTVFPSLSLGLLSLVLPQFIDIAHIGAALTGGLTLTYLTTLVDYYLPEITIVRMEVPAEDESDDQSKPRK